MAIYHCSTAAVSRSSGRSAVAAAAYRSGTVLTNERDGLVHDYRPRKGIEHREVVLPSQVSAPWAQDRSVLWNAAEAAERRKDARVAREVEVSLPHELDAKQRQALATELAQHLADRYRVAVDLAIHSPHGKTDARNHHAHLLMTTRTLTAGGLGGKAMLERENRELTRLGLPTTHQQVRELREAWADMANRHLARAEHDLRIDHRSHASRGIELTPTAHMGVHATQMSRKGMEVSRAALTVDQAQRNAALIRGSPEQVLALITAEKSVFDHRDVARVVNRYTEGAGQFQAVYGQVMASPELVRLTAETRDTAGRVTAPALYSTRDMVAVEARMDAVAARMAVREGHAVSEVSRSAGLAGSPQLDAGQRNAFEHVTGPQQLSVVVGYAGSGKSSMLGAARQAWQREGYDVRGAALAGKAAEGLQGSSGIESRTLASWERSWAAGREMPTANQVYVIDESGMVSSRQLERVLSRIEDGGAKAVLVGDPGQLQPIEAGAAFRAVAERTGFAQMDTVRRQQEAWQREASVAFGQHRTAEALRAYAERGAVHLAADQAAARTAIVKEYVADLRARPDGSRVALAHRRDDVRTLNEAIREERKAAGELRGEQRYRTTEGERSFAPGDRILFRENNRDLGVKNGTMGTVSRAEPGQLSVRLDPTSGPGPGRGREVTVPTEQYRALDHGYATTIHKSQGTTVDRSYVLASPSMDRHLSYVAMTRHTESAQLHGSREAFLDQRQLEQQLSRSGAKETTLDYTQATQSFAERRGRELDSQIVLRAPPAVDHARTDAERPVAGRGESTRTGPVPGAADAARGTSREAVDLPALAANWKNLEQQLDRLQERKNGPAREQVSQEMRGIAAHIRDNPKVRDAFLERQRELGVRRGSSLDRAVRDRNLDRAMDRVRDREKDRDR